MVPIFIGFFLSTIYTVEPWCFTSINFYIYFKTEEANNIPLCRSHVVFYYRLVNLQPMNAFVHLHLYLFQEVVSRLMILFVMLYCQPCVTLQIQVKVVTQIIVHCHPQSRYASILFKAFCLMLLLVSNISNISKLLSIKIHTLLFT